MGLGGNRTGYFSFNRALTVVLSWVYYSGLGGSGVD